MWRGASFIFPTVTFSCRLWMTPTTTRIITRIVKKVTWKMKTKEFTKRCRYGWNQTEGTQGGSSWGLFRLNCEWSCTVTGFSGISLGKILLEASIFTSYTIQFSRMVDIFWGCFVKQSGISHNKMSVLYCTSTYILPGILITLQFCSKTLL